MVCAAFAQLGNAAVGGNAVSLRDFIKGPLEPRFQMNVDPSLNDGFVVIGAQLRAGEVVGSGGGERRRLRGTQALCNGP